MSDTIQNSGLVNEVNKGEYVSNPSNNRKVGSELDKDAFLQLLVTQMRYQDPLDPMDNTQMIAQLAQFTALEQMQNLNSTMTNSQAFSLVGKIVHSVSYNDDTNSYDEIAGTVDSVKLQNGVAYLVIGDKEIKFSDVTNVYGSAEDISSSVGSINNNVVASQAMGLIGKTIQAITVDEDLNASDFIEGKVDYVKFNDEGTPILSVNGKEVFTYEVVSISEGNLLTGNTVTAYTDYNSETEQYNSITGSIEDVVIQDGNKIYVSIEGQLIEIGEIASLMDSIAYIGKNVVTEEVSGKVDSVVIKDKKPYLLVEGSLLNYEDLD